jgi:hypothetical protein
LLLVRVYGLLFSFHLIGCKIVFGVRFGTILLGDNWDCFVALYFCLHLFLLNIILLVPLLVFCVNERSELNQVFSIFGAETGFYWLGLYL